MLHSEKSCAKFLKCHPNGDTLDLDEWYVEILQDLAFMFLAC